MLLRTVRLLILSLLLSVPFTSFADDAPVYDVDNYPPQFDSEPIAANAAPAARSEEPIASQSLTQEERLKRLEQQIKNMSHSDTGSKLETAQTEIQSLRGQVEELTHQLQQAQNQQRLMYTELDKRLGQTAVEKKSSPVLADNVDTKKSSTTTAPAVAQAHTAAAPAAKKTVPVAVPVKTPAANDQPNVAEEQQIYQTAYDLIKEKKYNEAVNTLQKMLQKYPSGQFAANAHYWLGELYGLLNKNDQSAEEFATVVKKYPDSPKVADAQLKLGLIYAGQFKWSAAKAAFKKVVSNYPGTASARLASEQLKQLKQTQTQAAEKS